jgi:hypothetical protein
MRGCRENCCHVYHRVRTWFSAAFFVGNGFSTWYLPAFPSSVSKTKAFVFEPQAVRFFFAVAFECVWKTATSYVLFAASAARAEVATASSKPAMPAKTRSFVGQLPSPGAADDGTATASRQDRRRQAGSSCSSPTNRDSSSSSFSGTRPR